MSHIDTVQASVKGFFNHSGSQCYVRILDTPHVWGEPFDESIMSTARARTKEFEGAIVEIIQKSRYRCDVASLNSPDPSWGRVILEAMDVALTEKVGRTRPTQFMFLFGQTPTVVQSGGTPPNFMDFQGALLRLVRARSPEWEMMPEIWMGTFSRLQQGLRSGLSSVLSELVPSSVSTLGGLLPETEEDDVSTKMTWNHSKIIAVDGAEALVGGHNLNMDLFTSYPPALSR